MIVGYDLYTLVLPDSHAAVGSTKIDAHSWAINFLVRHPRGALSAGKCLISARFHHSLILRI
jgi:hypothetical protein